MSSPRYRSQRSFRPTAKASLYTALVLALLAVAVALRSFKPIALTIPIVLMMGYSSVFAQGASVEVARKPERGRSVAGEILKVELEVSCDKPSLLEIFEKTDAPMADGPPLFLLNLRGSANLKYTVSIPKRGIYRLGPTMIRFSDAFGFWEATYELGGVSEVVAYPKLLSVKGLKLAARYTGVWPGEVVSKRSGRGFEFHGVREYVPGDELRRVNWRATARLSKLMVNEGVEERVTDAVIVVDAGLATLLDWERAEELVDAEASLAGSLALTLVRAGNRVGLVIRGGENLWVKPGFGRKQLDKLLYALAQLEPGEPAPLDHALSMLVPYLLKPNAELIVISPMLDSTIASSLFELAQQYTVTVISPNPFTEGSGVANRLLEVERSSLIVKLSKACRVIDWAPGERILRAAKRRGAVQWR